MQELREFTQIIDNLNKVYPTLPNKAATIAVNFTKERFVDSAWLDATKEAWEKRKHVKNARARSRNILVQSGKLKRSVRKGIVTPDYAVIEVGGTGIPYARIHNEGGQIQGNFNVKEHKRTTSQKVKVQSTNLRTRKTTSRTKKLQGKETTVKAHIRKVDFIMPQRQFIGNSLTLDKRIQLQLTADISRALKV